MPDIKWTWFSGVHYVHERSEILRFYGGGGCTWPTYQLTAGANWVQAPLKTVEILLEIVYIQHNSVHAWHGNSEFRDMLMLAPSAWHVVEHVLQSSGPEWGGALNIVQNWGIAPYFHSNDLQKRRRGGSNKQIMKLTEAPVYRAEWKTQKLEI